MIPWCLYSNPDNKNFWKRFKKLAPEQHHRQVHTKPKKTDTVSLLRSRGLIYMNIISKAAINNANCFIMVLGAFTKLLKKKRPKLVQQKS
jgi:hypothetical protein